MIGKVVSGGQTGADRAALEVAAALGLVTGGWVPRGRRAEDGIIPPHHAGLVETDSDDPAQRTERNVRDSDATLVVAFGAPRGGSALTVASARAQRRPLLVLDLEAEPPDAAAARVRTWLRETSPRVLNVAGPRASEEPRIHAATTALLRTVLAPRGA